VAEKWEISYPLTPSLFPGGRGELRFWVQTTPGRHLGVFPECGAHWDWMMRLIRAAVKNRTAPSGLAQGRREDHGENQKEISASSALSAVSSDPRPVNVLNLFGYTGLATLAAAAAGAKVTHVDASKKSVAWARENQTLSGLSEKPVRWIVDDALKFVQREARRGMKYDGILLDPPKFGRGPNGEVWEVYKSLPELLQACRAVLSESPLFVVVTVYAIKASAVHIYYALEEMMKGFGGKTDCGELVTQEKSAGRLLSSAVYARWEGK
jgi:23S rRNA (cytosine1962-C5)-methyltransferase